MSHPTMSQHLKLILMLLFILTSCAEIEADADEISASEATVDCMSDLNLLAPGGSVFPTDAAASTIDESLAALGQEIAMSASEIAAVRLCAEGKIPSR